MPASTGILCPIHRDNLDRRHQSRRFATETSLSLGVAAVDRRVTAAFLRGVRPSDASRMRYRFATSRPRGTAAYDAALTWTAFKSQTYAPRVPQRDRGRYVVR